MRMSTLGRRSALALVIGLLMSLMSVPAATADPARPAPTPPAIGSLNFSKSRDVYQVPGYHKTSSGDPAKPHLWFTSCEKYSQTVRCKTLYWSRTRGTTIGTVEKDPKWVFNNLTYLPLMTRAQWGSNKLANSGRWTDGAGRRWRTECDTPRTGRGGCRTYIWTPGPLGYYWGFNNMVLFKGE